MSSHGKGHYCYVCGRERPNEKFSGWGHKKHVCKDFASRSEEGVNVVDLWDVEPLVDGQEVERFIANAPPALKLAVMLIRLCAADREDPNDTSERCTRATWGGIMEWLDMEGVAVRSQSGRSATLTELGYRVAEALLKKHGFDPYA